MVYKTGRKKVDLQDNTRFRVINRDKIADNLGYKTFRHSRDKEVR